MTSNCSAHRNAWKRKETGLQATGTTTVLLGHLQIAGAMGSVEQRYSEPSIIIKQA